MVNISKLGDSTIKFTFTDNDRYLYNGEITLPLNSLILEFDTSDLVIFKKIDGDVFVTFLLENSNFESKESLIDFYKTSMVGSTGGGGGVTPEEVEEMIDEAVSGKVNVSDNVVSAHTFNARSADGGVYITKLKFNGRHFLFNDFHSKKISVYPFVGMEGQLFTSLYLYSYNYVSYDVAAYLSGSTSDDYPSFTSVTWTGDETKMKAEINSEGYLDLIAQGDYWFGQIDSNITQELYVNILNDIASGQSASVINDSIVNNLENLGNTMNGIQEEISRKLDTTAYTPINVDSTLSQASANPIQNKSLFNELRVSGASSGDTTIVFVNGESTNYPEGVTVIKFEPTQSNTDVAYEFYNGSSYLGNIRVNYYGSISVELSLDGATYTTSGNTVILTVPSTLGITKITQWMGNYNNFTVKVENPPIYTPLKDVVNGKVDTSVFEIYSGNVETELSGKQDTLSAGTGIDITDNVISATGGGGGGKAIEAGRGISITSGETADTVSFNLPISAGTGTNSIAEGSYTTARGNYSHAEGQYAKANGDSSHAEGYGSSADGSNSHAEGMLTVAKASSAHAEGNGTRANNQAEHASGLYNVSNTGESTSAQTLFSVGNGRADNARHNAFEIRRNGDIYFFDGTNDVKLQDVISNILQRLTSIENNS